MLPEILIERQGKSGCRLGVVVKGNVWEGFRVAPHPFGFRRDRAPVLLQQDWQRSDRRSDFERWLEMGRPIGALPVLLEKYWQRSDQPSHFQPPLEIAGKRDG